MPDIAKIDRKKPLSRQDCAVGILCCAALIATRELPTNATVAQAYKYHHSLHSDGCFICAARNVCAVRVINE